MTDTELEIAPYLALMVNKEGEDIYFHSGAKILIKGPFGFAWIGEKLQPGQVDHIFRSVASDRKIMEFEEHGEVDFSLGVPNLGSLPRLRLPPARRDLPGVPLRAQRDPVGRGARPAPGPE
jgi:Tfp pilus assembly pilus retraction ATPase PilT